MATETQQLVDSLQPLTLHSFEGFCEDITAMFGNAAQCIDATAGQGPVSDLKKEFKKLASVNQVQASGVLDGTFEILLDQSGLFVLGGVFVMLPEKRILETIRGGTLKDADQIGDAIKEVGNLLVGSWDRVFREEQQGHKHFRQTGTFVGSIWDNPAQSLGMAVDQPCRYVVCRMKVDDLPEFKCAAVFPEKLFDTQVKPQPLEDTATPAAETPSAGDELTSASEDAAAACEIAPVDETVSVVDSEVKLTGIQPNAGPVSEAIRKMTQTAEPLSCTLPADALHLSAGQIMNPAVIWVDPEDTVEQVMRQMQQHNAGYVLVGTDGQVSGIVSRSDIAAALSPYIRPVFAGWRRPLDDATLQIRIKWFMSRPVHIVRSDAALTTVMETMVRQAVRGLPVVDASGQTVGLITVYDLLKTLLGSAGMRMTGQVRQAPPVV